MRICVYGGASSTVSKTLVEKTEELGRQIAKRGHSMVYGAGANGMMGAAARGCKEYGGHIIGVVPKFFEVDGIIFPDCDELIRPDTMRERKQIMEDYADAFVITPGGIGTFEEFFEILTLKQLSQHNKPMVVFNIDGYYDDMQEFMKNALEHKFLKEACFNLYEVCTEVEEIFEYLDNYKPVEYNIIELKSIKTEQ